jgi:DNA-binding GntR family transcriptional regulator
VKPEKLLTEAVAASAAYHGIKQRIISTEFRPGEKLSEARLAAELGLGRSPIRTALARLKGEGWVEVSPQSGTYVRGLSTKEIDDVLEIRLLLETHAAGVAAHRIGDDALRRLRRAFAESRPTATNDRTEQYLDVDLQVHLAICEAAGNELIRQNIVNLIDKIRWIRRASTGWPVRIQEAYEELEALLAALERRDADAARDAMRRHIENVIRFRQFLRVKPEFMREPVSRQR